jgi:hypothetical protein
MQSMKDRGWREIDAALRRVRRLHSLDRIRLNDKTYIEDRLQQVLARIASMTEEDKNGDPIGGE